MKKQTITVEGVEVRLYTKKDTDFICITDIARKFNEDTNVVIQNWLRNGNTLDYLGLWETMHNDDFKPLEFEGFRKRAGSNNFFISPKQWIEKTGAIGIESRAGRYGGTYAHRDIALEFCSYLSPAFKLYLVKEFQRLKEGEAERLSIEWNVNRTLSKVNYLIHTDAVRENLIPIVQHRTPKEGIYFASEADMLNQVVFGRTAKEWRQANPELKGNMRDYATIEQLLVMANMENLNAEYMSLDLSREERYIRLQAVAAHQLSLIANNPSLRRLEDQYRRKGVGEEKGKKPPS